jgi:hypothetical protein
VRARFDFRRLRPADLYDAWLFAAAEATLSLATCLSAPTRETRDAYAVYVAALDREAHAAEVLAQRIRCTTRALESRVQLPA